MTQRVPYDLVLYVHENGKLPVVNFAAGGVATPADAALMMQLGAEGVLRRIRNLQIWKSSQTSSSDRTGSHKLYRCQTNRRIIQRPWRSNGRNQRTGNRIINGRKRKIR